MTATLPDIASVTQQSSGQLAVTFADGTQAPLAAVLSRLYGANGNPLLPNSDGSLNVGLGGSAPGRTNPLYTDNAVLAAAAAQYRTVAGGNAITAIDQAAAPTVGTTSIQNGGSLVNGSTYNCKVSGHTQFGDTTQTAGTARAAGVSTGTLRIPITQLTGALSYDVYVSTDADPKFVGRITEARRASGCIITVAASGSTPATVTAGGVAGAVDVQVPGTGSQGATTRAVNTAWVIPAGAAAVNCTGYDYVDFDINWTNLVGDQSATQPALTVAGVLLDGDDSLYYLAPSQSYTFGGQTAGVLTGRTNSYRMQCRGRSGAHLLVLSMAPLSAGISIDVRAVLS